MARPQFKPTPALRRRVAICAGAGVAHEEIALGLGIARGTLEKHFAHELTTGAFEKRQEVIDAMFKAAKKGNVAAQKAFVALQPGIAPPPLKGGKAPKPGKKEQANLEAACAQTGTDWQELLAPQRVQ